MRYFYIDLENVRNEGFEGVLSLGEDDFIFVFYSDNALNLSIPTLENINNSKSSVKYIKTNYIGKNAMDFQIVSLFGAMIERNREGSFYIISHDNGFKSAVSFCESYFSDYKISCGVYPTIISAITADMKNSSAKKNTASKEQNATSQKASGTKSRTKGKASDGQAADEEQQDNAQKARENDRKVPQKNPADASADSKHDRQYIYDCLSELLSEKTIDIYAESIHEGLISSSNKDELRVFFKERYGEAEGEALYRVTQSDFDKLKKQAMKAETAMKSGREKSSREKRKKHGKATAGMDVTDSLQDKEAESSNVQKLRKNQPKAEAGDESADVTKNGPKAEAEREPQTERKNGPKDEAGNKVQTEAMPDMMSQSEFDSSETERTQSQTGNPEKRRRSRNRNSNRKKNRSEAAGDEGSRNTSDAQASTNEAESREPVTDRNRAEIAASDEATEPAINGDAVHSDEDGGTEKVQTADKKKKNHYRRRYRPKAKSPVQQN